MAHTRASSDAACRSCVRLGLSVVANAVSQLHHRPLIHAEAFGIIAMGVRHLWGPV